MDQVTQQNAALVEEAAAAADAMREQAGALAQAVGIFKLDGTNAAASALPATARSVSNRKSAAAAPAVARRTPRAAARPQVASNDGWEEF
jgi:hypothetical protein